VVLRKAKKALLYDLVFQMIDKLCLRYLFNSACTKQKYKIFINRYQFEQMILHWGNLGEGASEHSVNGIHYPLEVQVNSHF